MKHIYFCVLERVLYAGPEMASSRTRITGSAGIGKEEVKERKVSKESLRRKRLLTARVAPVISLIE